MLKTIHITPIFLLILDIAASLKCYLFTEYDLAILSTKIANHNKNYVELYAAGFTPKIHSLLHLPNQIRLFGPLRYSWCYRYESKHAPLKKIVRRNWISVMFL